MSDSLSAALATLRSRYGPQALRRGGLPEEAGSWSTAVPVLDGVLTPGGLPHGRGTLRAAAGRGPPPGPARWERGLVMARALVAAGMPWVGVALGGEQPRPSLWEHALAALAEAVAKRGAICVIATPAPVAAPLRHASSLTLLCTAAGWQRANGDVVGLRVRLTTAKSKLGAPGAEATVLLRYPRPYATAEVIGLPSVVVPRLQPISLPIPDVAGVA